ncbi:hypothetical protein BVN1_09580 [Bacillus velezensis]|nr:hypothetical protein BVN1_09580 [Bacillus velezensis]
MKEMLKNNPEEGCFFIKRNPKNKGFAYPADPHKRTMTEIVRSKFFI